MTMRLSAERVRDLLDYDPATGELSWRQGAGKSRHGKKTGYIRSDWYIVIKIDRHNYLAHRLAWAWMHGEWPREIDHRDLDPSNNRIENLRVATRSQNKANTKARANNTSGFKGVFRHSDGDAWFASIKVNGKSVYLGRFATPELAHAAYVAGSRKFHGEFARAA